MAEGRRQKSHTGSGVARVNKARAATLGTRGRSDSKEESVTEFRRSTALRTRGCGGQMATESCNKDEGGNYKLRTSSGKQLKIGVWNVRTLWQTGSYGILKKQLDRVQYDMVGICEVRWTEEGETDGGRFVWSGSKEKHENGVGLLMSEKARKAMLGYNPVNERVLTVRFNAYPKNITVIVVYAPTTSHSDEEIETFYERLEDVIEKVDKNDMKIVIGDWNAKIGHDNTGWEDEMGLHGLGDRNSRGERLLLFAKQYSLYVANTKFYSRYNRKWTWESFSGEHRNMIDFVLTEQKIRSGITRCRSVHSVDVGSDHQLVMCHISVKISSKTRNGDKPFKYDLDKLKDKDTVSKIRQILRVNITESDEQHEDVDAAVGRVTRSLKEAGAEWKRKEKPKKAWITSDTLTLVEARRKMKNTGSIADKERYRALCKDIKKSARQDKRKWIENQCTEMSKYFGASKTKEAYKIVHELKGQMKRTMKAINDKNGNLMTEESEISSRWTEYARELFTGRGNYDEGVVMELNNRSGQHSSMNDEDEILLSEVENAINKLKNNKSPGIDDIPAELIRAGGPQIAKEIHVICNKIWKEGRWPTDWSRSILVMLPKKGCLRECTNYRSISLISHMCKIMLNVLLERMKGALEAQLSEEQGGFRKDRSTVQQILTLRLIAEEVTERQGKLYNCFIDFQKAFDSVWHQGLWAVLNNMMVPEKLVTTIKALYEHSQVAVRSGETIGDWVKMTVGSRQGDPLSPLLFTALLEKVMEKMECEERGGVKIQGQVIKDLRFADDIDMLAKSEEDLQSQVTSVHEDSKRYGLQMNKKKTKVMVMGKENSDANIQVEGEEIECVNQFIYLGSLISNDNDCSKEIKRRIGIAAGALGKLCDIWKSSSVLLKEKMKLLDACVFSTLMYACETWTLKKTDIQRLNSFEMKCYRKVLGIRWNQFVRNERVRELVSRPKEIVETIIGRKMSLFGHICRMEEHRLIKTVMLGSAEGKRGKGRPRRKWLDDIKEWCNTDIISAVRMAQNRKGFWAKK